MSEPTYRIDLECNKHGNPFKSDAKEPCWNAEIVRLGDEVCCKTLMYFDSRDEAITAAREWIATEYATVIVDESPVFANSDGSLAPEPQSLRVAP